MSHKRNNRNRSEQRKLRSLANIVREKTNDGEVIVDFYLDVVRGKLDDEGFEVCHKLEAAEQVHAIAPGLVAEYIAQLTGIECNHAIPAGAPDPQPSFPRRREPIPVRIPTTPTAPARATRRSNTWPRHSRLHPWQTTPASPASSAGAPTTARPSSASSCTSCTASSGASGPATGSRPPVSSSGHIARDDLARSGSVTVIPADAGIQDGGDGDGSATEGSFPSSREPAPGPAGARLTVIPADAGIQDGGDVEGLPSRSPRSRRPGGPRLPARLLRHRPQDRRGPAGPVPPNPQVRTGIRRGRRRLPRQGQRQR